MQLSFVIGIKMFPLLNSLIWINNLIFKTLDSEGYYPKSDSLTLAMLWVLGNCFDNLTGFLYGIKLFRVCKDKTRSELSDYSSKFDLYNNNLMML